MGRGLCNSVHTWSRAAQPATSSLGGWVCVARHSVITSVVSGVNPRGYTELVRRDRVHRIGAKRVEVVWAPTCPRRLANSPSAYCTGMAPAAPSSLRMGSDWGGFDTRQVLLGQRTSQLFGAPLLRKRLGPWCSERTMTSTSFVYVVLVRYCCTVALLSAKQAKWELQEQRSNLIDLRKLLEEADRKARDAVAEEQTLKVGRLSGWVRKFYI